MSSRYHPQRCTFFFCVLGAVLFTGSTGCTEKTGADDMVENNVDTGDSDTGSMNNTGATPVALTCDDEATCGGE